MTKKEYLQMRAIRAFNSGAHVEAHKLSSPIYEGLGLKDAAQVRAILEELELKELHGETLPAGACPDLRHKGEKEK